MVKRLRPPARKNEHGGRGAAESQLVCVGVTVNDSFWQGFTSGMNEGVFHRSERATLYSSERWRRLAEGTRDGSCGKPSRGASGWWPVGLLINTYLNTLMPLFDNTKTDDI
jgi:hypothetical protein